MIIAGTGHRPDKLGGYSPEKFQKLVQIAEANSNNSKMRCEARNEKLLVISGMAQGWDQALAQAAVNLCVPFAAYIPFKGQESRWPEEAQRYYRELLAKAKTVLVCSEGEYANWKMQKRNRMMVDDADMILAMYNGSAGGTRNCIKYAEQKNKPVVNLYDKFVYPW